MVGSAIIDGGVRWRWALGAAAAALVLGSCGTPPPGDGEPEPGDGLLACADAPVYLDPAVRIESVAADGSAAVLTRIVDEGTDDARFDHSILDTGGGSEWWFWSSPAQHDGTFVQLSSDGGRAVSIDYPSSADHQRPFVLHDVATRRSTPLPATLTGWTSVEAIDEDLTTALVSEWNPGAFPTYARMDLATGTTTPADWDDVGWWNAAFSPDTSRVAQIAGSGIDRKVRVISTLTGSVVHDLGTLRFEDRSFFDVRFIDDDTVLFDGVVAPGSTAGERRSDAALLNTELGLWITVTAPADGASVEWSDPVGTRLLYSVGYRSLHASVGGSITDLGQWQVARADRHLRWVLKLDAEATELRCL